MQDNPIEWKLETQDEVRACCCRGPQNGDPLCPCMMRGVQVRNGRYVRVTDIGPAPAKDIFDD